MEKVLGNADNFFSGRQERCCTCSLKSMLKCCLHIPESSSPRRETGQDEQLNRKWITSYIIFLMSWLLLAFKIVSEVCGYPSHAANGLCLWSWR